MEGKINYRIKWFSITTFIIFFLAIVGDAIGLIPIAKNVTATIFWGIASIYFWIKGMGLFNGRKLATMGISWLGSQFPAIQEFPLLTLGIFIVIWILRLEDRTGISLSSLKNLKGLKSIKDLKSIGVTPPRLPRDPVNSTPGVRLPRQSVDTDNISEG